MRGCTSPAAPSQPNTCCPPPRPHTNHHNLLPPQLLRELGLLPLEDVAELAALVVAVEQVGTLWRGHGAAQGRHPAAGCVSLARHLCAQCTAAGTTSR